MILKIETGSNNPILHQNAEEVKTITPAIKQLVLDMEETLLSKSGLGLAGPQVGQNIRIIQIDISALCPDPQEQTVKQITLINPKIIKKSWRKTVLEEGCLSLPKLYLEVKRPAKVTIEALNTKGEPLTIEATGLLAKIIQHEMDHLDGILITDKQKKKA